MIDTTRSRRLLALVLIPLAATACIDASRINATCTWTDTEAHPLDLSRRVDREHLRQDVQVAGDVGLRLADAQFRHRPDMNEPIRERCTAALYDSIASRHAVTPAAITAAETDRLWWADLLAVYLPLALFVAVAADLAVRHVCQLFDPEQKPVAIGIIAAFVPMIAALAVGVGQIWGFTVEGLVLRNEHVSFRAFFVPIMRHGWIAFFGALAVAAPVAAARLRVTPVRRPKPAYIRSLERRPARTTTV